MTETYLVTGGAGFIGAAVITRLLANQSVHVVNIDKLTYASNPAALDTFAQHSRYSFEQADVADADAMRSLFARYRPVAVMHLAAESHVDRSIDSPHAFVRTNVLGTYTLLNSALEYWSRLDPEGRSRFRFLHVSTDEVYGSLGPTGTFTEQSRYDPRSPYAATKASADHLVRAWHHTYGLPAMITNCSNNYGPWQFPEKLIPLTIVNALSGAPIAVYGKGDNVRDWLHVEDHASALIAVVRRGEIGRTYMVSAGNERPNIDVVHLICDIIDEYDPPIGASRRTLVEFVEDRPGHDFRYALDGSRLSAELGWTPEHTFSQGLSSTVRWYIENRAWWERIRSTKYAGERIGRGDRP